MQVQVQVVQVPCKQAAYPTRLVNHSLRASSPIWASEASLARTRERATKPRGASAPRSRVLARLSSLAQTGELARRLCEPNRLRTITIMKSVRFSYSLLVSCYVLVRKVKLSCCCLVLHVLVIA